MNNTRDTKVTLGQRIGKMGCVFVCTLTFLFLGGTGNVRAAEGKGKAKHSSNTDREIKLVLPENILDLPKIVSKRYTVWKPSGWKDFTYIHNSIVSYCNGRLYVAWHATKRGEHSRVYVDRVVSAPMHDLSNWTDPVIRSKANDNQFLAYMRKKFKLPDKVPYRINNVPRALHTVGNRIYMFVTAIVWPDFDAMTTDRQPFLSSKSRNESRLFYCDDPAGLDWKEMSPKKVEDLKKNQGYTLGSYGTNHHFIPLSDGRLMAAHMRGTPITKDKTGLSGWNKPQQSVPLRRWHEPAAYEGPDGVLHWIIRNGRPPDIEFVWHAYSKDRGKTWTKLKPQRGFTDNAGNKEFGKLPNGWVWCVSNPMPFSPRTHLVLGISRDGWTFDNNYLLRWEPWTQLYPAPAKGHQPGYEYPSACYHDGKLYVTYSHVRDFVELAVVDVNKIIKP